MDGDVCPGSRPGHYGAGLHEAKVTKYAFPHCALLRVASSRANSVIMKTQIYKLLASLSSKRSRNQTDKRRKKSSRWPWPCPSRTARPLIATPPHPQNSPKPPLRQICHIKHHRRSLTPCLPAPQLPQSAVSALFSTSHPPNLASSPSDAATLSQS